MRFILSLTIFISIISSTMRADVRSDVNEFFTRDMTNLDFACVKIEVDRMIDPSINVEAQLAQIDQMVATIEKMLPSNADSWDKVEAIRRYIYQADA